MKGIEKMNSADYRNGGGSDRTKSGPTPKQDKWKDPFYAFARGKSPAKSLFNHKVDSIRESLQGIREEVKNGFFGRIKNALVNFFRLDRSRKGLA